MTDRVICNKMSGADNQTRNVRTRFHKSSDEKESCFDFVPREDLEEPFGVDVVGSVIISQCQVTRIWTMR